MKSCVPVSYTVSTAQEMTNLEEQNALPEEDDPCADPEIVEVIGVQRQDAHPQSGQHKHHLITNSFSP